MLCFFTCHTVQYVYKLLYMYKEALQYARVECLHGLYIAQSLSLHEIKIYVYFYLQVHCHTAALDVQSLEQNNVRYTYTNLTLLSFVILYNLV